MATSFFPSVPLDKVLEIEFCLSYNLGIPFTYNDQEYYELVWRYERLVDQRKKENESERQQDGMTSLGNLSPGLLNKLSKGANGSDK